MNSLFDMLAGLPPSDIPAWWYWTALALAAWVIGVAKSGFGGGVGILAVPLVASTVGGERGVGVILPVLIAADVVAVVQHRRHVSWPLLRPALVGAAVGIAAATLVIVLFRQGQMLNAALNLTVGGVCLLLVMLQVYRMLGGHVPRLPGTPGFAAATGGVAGGVSTLAHAAGPIMSIYWLDRKIPKAQLIGSLVVFFFVVNLAKVPSFMGLGLIHRGTLLESAWMLPVIPLGSAAGWWMHRRIPEKPFTIIMYVGAAAAAGWMIYKTM